MLHSLQSGFNENTILESLKESLPVVSGGVELAPQSTQEAITELLKGTEGQVVP